MEATIDVNMYHPTLLLKVMLDKLLRREKQFGGIIILSSVASAFSLPANIPYSASKVYSKYLGEAVEFELKKYKEGKSIDVQVLCPHFAASRMLDPINDSARMQVALIASSTTAVASASLNQLYDIETVSNGTLKHDIINSLQGCFSRNTPNYVTKIAGYGFYDK